MLSDEVAMWDTDEPPDEDSTGDLERYSRHPRIGDGVRYYFEESGLSDVADGRLVEQSAVDSARLVGVAVPANVSPDWEWSTEVPSSLPPVADTAPVPRDQPLGRYKVASDDRVSTDSDQLVLQFGFSVGGWCCRQQTGADRLESLAKALGVSPG